MTSFTAAERSTRSGRLASANGSNAAAATPDEQSRSKGLRCDRERFSLTRGGAAARDGRLRNCALMSLLTIRWFSRAMVAVPTRRGNSASRRRNLTRIATMQGDEADRAVHVELRIAVELILSLLALGLVFLWFRSALGAGAIWLAVLLSAAVAWSTFKRWRVRLQRWHLVTEWQSRPVHREGSFVIQRDSNGEAVGQIDTAGHYTVTWERFDARSALYVIVQGTQTVTISTLSPDAADLLVGALNVRNFPCEEWPNLDL